MKKLILIIIFTLFLIKCKTNCHTSNHSIKSKMKLITNTLHLNKKEIHILKKRDTIVKEVYTSIIDTVNLIKINRRLDSFFKKSYNEKQLLIILQLDRFLKEGNFEFDSKFDTLKPVFKSVKNFKKYIDSTKNDRKL